MQTADWREQLTVAVGCGKSHQQGNDDGATPGYGAYFPNKSTNARTLVSWSLIVWKLIVCTVCPSFDFTLIRITSFITSSNWNVEFEVVKSTFCYSKMTKSNPASLEDLACNVSFNELLGNLMLCPEHLPVGKRVPWMSFSSVKTTNPFFSSEKARSLARKKLDHFLVGTMSDKIRFYFF